MNRPVEPNGDAAPAANYALAVVSESPSRLRHTSGIVGATADGTVPTSIGDQADVIWTSILTLLAEADMVPGDIVSVTTYVVADHAGDLGAVMAARDRYMAGHRAASTLVTVPALARPEWLMEITIVAAAGG